MTIEEQKRLYDLVMNPPPGSKIEAAKQYGVDLTLNLRSLAMTPTERVQAMDDALEFMEELQRGAATPNHMNRLGTAVKALVDAGVNFVIIGGFAAVVQGATFLTRDLDICYERSPENLKRLVAAFTAFHPRLRGAPEGAPFLFDERTLSQGMNFTLSTDVGDIDLIGEVAGFGGFSEFATDAAQISLYGVSFRAASPDSLIRSKRAAGRPKDLKALPELEALRQLREQEKKKPQK